jgi:uncharacterized protein (UPF0303 family)
VPQNGSPPPTIAELVDQEQRLQFPRFDNHDAWNLGGRLVELATTRELAVTIDIRRHGQQLFHAALPGTTPENDSWIERKVRVVDRFAASSLLVRLRLAESDQTLDQDLGVDPALYAAHGGCFPLRIRDVGSSAPLPCQVSRRSRITRWSSRPSKASCEPAPTVRPERRAPAGTCRG